LLNCIYRGIKLTYRQLPYCAIARYALHTEKGNAYMTSKKRTIRVSVPQLAKFGLEMVNRDPLVIRCSKCGVEWRPMRMPQMGNNNKSWQCQNGCHQPKA
jgi:hypothetical protein